ncbi:hypothetical protein FQZ97_1050720 [compost metagenome]
MLISVTAVAAISIWSFCCCRPRVLSSITELISSAADASCRAESLMPRMVVRRLPCISSRALSNCAASSLPLMSIGALRSPEAIRRATFRAWLIGAVMLRVSSQARSNVANSAATMIAPTTHCARWYINAAASAAVSAPC